MIPFAVGLVGALGGAKISATLLEGGNMMLFGVPPLARLTYKLINIKDNKLTITQSYKQVPHSLVAHKGPADLRKKTANKLFFVK